jgi:hypothetical protein
MKQTVNTNIEQNPFEGLKSTLALFKSIQSGRVESESKENIYSQLKSVKDELKKSLDKETANKMFYTLLFMGGDISNREHTGLGKVEAGGFGQRKFFTNVVQFMVENDFNQFIKFLDVIPEYTNFENIILNNIKTDRYKGTIQEINFLNLDYHQLGTILGHKVIVGDIKDYSLLMLAKFLPKVPVSKRYKVNKEGEKVSRSKQQFTIEKDNRTFKLIQGFSKALNLQVLNKESHLDYIGYRKWRSKFLQETEAHLFSSGQIENFDKIQFENWIQTLPAGARYAVQCRLLNKDEKGTLTSTNKWKLSSGEDMADVYLGFMKQKEQAMKKLVSMTDSDKKGMDKKELRKLEKSAKVTTGGLDLFDAFIKLLSNPYSSEANLLAQTLVDKVTCNVPVLVFADISGSMHSRNMGYNIPFGSNTVAGFLTSLFLYKNADLDAGSYFFLFEDKLHVVYEKADVEVQKNRFTSNNKVVVDKLIRTTEPFLDNWNRIRQIVETTRGGTDVSQIAVGMKTWLNEDKQLTSQRMEIISKYPVWLIISDGEFNNGKTVASSLQEMKHIASSCGVDPVIVIWDVTQSNNSSNYENIENVVHVSGFNTEVLNTVFSNITNHTFIDIYLPLQTLFNSNRYKMVQDNVLVSSKTRISII